MKYIIFIVIFFNSRETCAVTKDSLAIIRFGTCGGISKTSIPGSIVISSHGSGMISRNYNYFSKIKQI